jgi:16S rRNA (guanine527-N7)-methyltransferase
MRPRRGGDPKSILDRQRWDTLVPHLERAGANPAIALPRLKRYAEMLVEWNRKVSNLISGHDEPRFVERHLRESLEPAGWLRDSGTGRWLDFGAGAGLPGIPLAIAGIGGSWLMVESRRPKTLFMRKCLQELSLENIEVHHGRLEEVIASGAENDRIDVLVSRATMPMGPTLVLAESLVRQGGCAFLWKGSRRHEEVADSAAWQSAWEVGEEMSVGEGQTAVVKLKRK